MRQRGQAADRQLGQVPGGDADAPRRRQHEACVGAAEGDQADAVALLIGVDQQREDGRLGLGHPLAGHPSTGWRRRRRGRGAGPGLAGPCREGRRRGGSTSPPRTRPRPTCHGAAARSVASIAGSMRPDLGDRRPDEDAAPIGRRERTRASRRRSGPTHPVGRRAPRETRIAGSAGAIVSASSSPRPTGDVDVSSTEAFSDSAVGRAPRNTALREPFEADRATGGPRAGDATAEGSGDGPGRGPPVGQGELGDGVDVRRA